MLVLSKLLHQKVSKMCQNGPHNDLFVSSPIIFPKDWVSLLFAELVGHCAEIFLIWVSRYLENAYPTHFLTSKDTLFVADEHDFSAWVLGFHNKVHEIVSPKSVQISAQYRFHTPSCTNSTPLFQKPYTSKPPLWLFDTFSTRKM